MQLTIIESVAADGSPPIPSTIICLGKYFMESWFHDNFNSDELLLLSETGYMNEEVTIEWLKYFIKHTGAGPKQPWNILLMNSYRTDESPEFVLLALANHIQPFEFLSHLIHILQPLDISIF